MQYEVVKEYTTCLESINKIKEPRLYNVRVHNDDFTPMEFVIGILEKFFYMDRRQATNIMLEAHMKGKASCGVYSKEVAESKVSQVVDYARLHEHPLICSMEAA
jgi:ATP-dependent Clp protease adaptor protein ClpS